MLVNMLNFKLQALKTVKYVMNKIFAEIFVFFLHYFPRHKL